MNFQCNYCNEFIALPHKTKTMFKNDDKMHENYQLNRETKIAMNNEFSGIAMNREFSVKS